MVFDDLATSSPPIEPPAPVTITALPEMSGEVLPRTTTSRQKIFNLNVRQIGNSALSKTISPTEGKGSWSAWDLTTEMIRRRCCNPVLGAAITPR